MDAPVYLPAAVFEQPAPAPFTLRSNMISLAELMKWPAAWAIVLKHAPSTKFMVGAAQMKPHLGNFTLDGLIAFGVFDQKTVDAISLELSTLPISELPAQ